MQVIIIVITVHLVTVTEQPNLIYIWPLNYYNIQITNQHRSNNDFQFHSQFKKYQILFSITFTQTKLYNLLR